MPAQSPSKETLNQTTNGVANLTQNAPQDFLASVKKSAKFNPEQFSDIRVLVAGAGAFITNATWNVLTYAIDASDLDTHQKILVMQVVSNVQWVNVNLQCFGTPNFFDNLCAAFFFNGPDCKPAVDAFKVLRGEFILGDLQRVIWAAQQANGQIAQKSINLAQLTHPH